MRTAALTVYQTKPQGVIFNLLTSGNLNEYLADLDEQAEEMFSQLVEQTKQAEGVTEHLKATDQMEWVRRMNLIRNRAEEVVLNKIILC